MSEPTPETKPSPPAVPPPHPIVRWIFRRRLVLLAVGIVSMLLAWAPASRLQFDQSIESLYARDNPRLQAYQRSKATFGGDEFILVAWEDAKLFDRSGRLSRESERRISSLSDRLQTVPGLVPGSVQNLADALKFPYGRSRIKELVRGLLLGTDDRTTCVIIRIMPEKESPVVDGRKVTRGDTIRMVREIAAEMEPTAVVVGEPVQIHEMFRYVEEDGAVLGRGSMILLVLVILVFFRSWRWMIIPVAVVLATLVWTFGLMEVSGARLSMVSSMLQSLVMIIGTTTVIHLTLTYRDLRESLPPFEALQKAFVDLIEPVFWTTVTTAAGFASLLTSQIAPVASFGLVMAVGTMLVMLAMLLLIPGLALVRAGRADPRRAPAERQMVRGLGRVTDVVTSHPWASGLVMLLLSVFCALGLFRLEVETDFSKNFRASSPIVQALNFFETRLGGAGNWEVNFAAPAELTEEYLEKVRGLTEELRELEKRETPDRLTKVTSLADGLDLIPSSFLFRRIAFEQRERLLNSFQPDFVQGLYSREDGRMRIMLRALERQPSDTKLKLIHEVEEIARRRFPDAQATGLFVLLTYLIESLMDDQVSSFYTSALFLVGMMWAAQRSLWLGVALLLPNVFPLVLVIGTMGWIGLPINIATAMIASISLGLTVDSSILYMAGFRAARARGEPLRTALRSTNEDVGLTLILTNAALVAGFCILTLSHFIPLVYFGILVSVAMVGGLFGNVILLPLILTVMYRREIGPESAPPAAEAAPPVPTAE